ncbi:MAG: TetR/AcrR family transcriptional regulator [Rhodospirillales bacterium]|jgi:TetR/AcrR family transcriptional regulator
MARPRAADYDDKRAAILRRAAELFAEKGYDRTSMTEIAAALGVSKALFYHYYPSKDALLFDIIRTHLNELVAVAEAAAAARPALAPRSRFRSIIAAILDCYRDADAEHKIQINHLGQLAEAEQAELKTLERRLVAVMASAVRALRPELEPELVKPVVMSIFGTLNWTYMWFREGGKLSREAYADLVTQMFADGIDGAGVRLRAAQ